MEESDAVSCSWCFTLLHFQARPFASRGPTIVARPLRKSERLNFSSGSSMGNHQSDSDKARFEEKKHLMMHDLSHLSLVLAIVI